MRYLSTRDKSVRLSAAQAISMGLARDGGLFVPETLPHISMNTVTGLCEMSYRQRAVYIMGMFLEGFTSADITSFTEKAYNSDNFDVSAVAPVRELTDGTYFLELWHGPTCAFKDMALQILPHMLTASMEKLEDDRNVCILTATSGDTGKAALAGFKNVAKTKILVFYPQDGVSNIQKLQMVTQDGENVGVCAVRGNFDDAQTGVKRIFSDTELRKEAEQLEYQFSSANSINWGRLLPQIVYYISAYCDLIKDGRIKVGDKINYCVPTGNFGNILAGFYAKSMGLPIKQLICASNANNVLTDFINTGVYDRNREFHNTISPSMDILVSSNLERLIFELSGNDDVLVSDYMNSLSKAGVYKVNDKIRAGLDSTFWAAYCDDYRTKLVINSTFKNYGYLIDPHTAVAYDVLTQYRRETGDKTPAVVVSTASPYKFCDSVLSALGYETKLTGVELIDRLSDVTGIKAPRPLLELKTKKVRFKECVSMSEMPNVVMNMLR